MGVPICFHALDLSARECDRQVTLKLRRSTALWNDGVSHTPRRRPAHCGLRSRRHPRYRPEDQNRSCRKDDTRRNSPESTTQGTFSLFTYRRRNHGRLASKQILRHHIQREFGNSLEHVRRRRRAPEKISNNIDNLFECFPGLAATSYKKLKDTLDAIVSD